MAIFAYKAVDAAGRFTRGKLQATNLEDLDSRLKRLGLDLVDGKEKRAHLWEVARGIPRSELINFCFHMEMLARAGIPIMEAMADIRDTTEHRRLKETMASLVESVEGGAVLSKAMEQHPEVFSGVLVSVIRAGEHSGKLPEVLKKLGENLRWEDELASYTKRLFIYPAIVTTLVLAALTVAMVYVVPQLSKLFTSAGQDLPLQTRILIATSHFVVNYGLWLVGALIAALLGLKAGLMTSPALRFHFDRSKLRLPVIGIILHKIILCRFTALFTLMYASGVNILEALRLCEEVVGNVAVRASLVHASDMMHEGQHMTEAFARASLFPPLVTRMMKVGEQAGNLEEALDNAGYFFDRDVKESTLKLQAMIEPLLTTVLGGLMLWVMLSVLGPVYDILTKIK